MIRGSSGGTGALGAVLVSLSPFVGREVELGELSGLLKASRLLTLTGPGGSGKTRLAMELIRRMPESGQDVVLIGFDGVDDPELVVSAVGAALGVGSVAGQSRLDQVVAHLVGSQILLVLDNCEQVRDSVAQLVRAAMAVAPRLRVLATSRIVLSIDGEQVWSVPPLELPLHRSGPADVDRSDAGRLFVERARHRWVGFTLDNTNSAAVTRICRLLDGLPLALELAAAWCGVMSPSELVDRLEDGLELLDRGSGSGRHRTLRATIEWSDALLAPQDRRLLAKLSVFAGRFSTDDAEAVTQPVEVSEMLFALRRLVDSSWVTVSQADETSYGLLNTLRTYARDLLLRSDDGEETRRLHATRFTLLAEGSEAGLVGPEQAAWRTRMEQTAGDVEAALDWVFKSGETDLLHRLVGSLWRWWYTTGRIAQGRRWTAAALGGSRPSKPSFRARALYASGMLAAENGDYVTASAHAQSARREFEAIGDHGAAARCNTVLGNVARYRGDRAAARTHLADAVASQRRLGDDLGTAVALQNLAALVIDQDDVTNGRELMAESLDLKRRVGDQRSLGYGLINLSDLLRREAEPDQARAALDEAGSIATALGDHRLAAFVEHNLGDVAVAVGDQMSAVAHYRRALLAFRDVRDERDVALALCSLGVVLLAAGVRREGLEVLRESESLAAAIGDEIRLAEARAALRSAAVPPSAKSLPGGLTARQAEILGLLAGGLSNRDIALSLNLSSGTIERHLANIYLKIGVTNRVGATRYALAHGLGTTPTP